MKIRRFILIDIECPLVILSNQYNFQSYETEESFVHRKQIYLYAAASTSGFSFPLNKLLDISSLISGLLKLKPAFAFLCTNLYF